MAAANAGKMELYFNLPIRKTSIPKIAPASGVPKTEPKPAAMAAIISVFLSAELSLKGLVKRC